MIVAGFQIGYADATILVGRQLIFEQLPRCIAQFEDSASHWKGLIVTVDFDQFDRASSQFIFGLHLDGCRRSQFDNERNRRGIQIIAERCFRFDELVVARFQSFDHDFAFCIGYETGLECLAGCILQREDDFRQRLAGIVAVDFRQFH